MLFKEPESVKDEYNVAKEFLRELIIESSNYKSEKQYSEDLMEAIEKSHVDDYSLYTMKKLSNHHKAFLYSMLSLVGDDGEPLVERDAAIHIFNEFSKSVKWEKDCYFCVLTYMLVQSLRGEYGLGCDQITDCLKNLFSQ